MQSVEVHGEITEDIITALSLVSTLSSQYDKNESPLKCVPT